MSSEVAYISTRQVAEHFGVDPSTVRRWAETGRVTSIRTPGGQLRFPMSVLDIDNEDEAVPA